MVGKNIVIWQKMYIQFFFSTVFLPIPIIILLMVKGPVSNHKKLKKIKAAVFEGSKVKVQEGMVFSDLIKWSHTRYPMKDHSLCYKMVHLILNQKWESYTKFNTGSHKVYEAHIVAGFIWPQVLYTNWFRPILRGSCENFCWTDWNYPCAWIVYHSYSVINAVLTKDSLASSRK